MTGSCGWFPIPHEAIVAWVNAHRDDLPTTLAELSRLPIPFRKVIVGAAPNEVRAALWAEHLAQVLETEADLSGEQRECIADHVRAMPAIFHVKGAGRAVHGAWSKERMVALFGAPLWIRVFETLGPPEPEGGLPLPPDALQFA